MRKLLFNFDYKVKKKEGDKKETIIEGYANRSYKKGNKVIDRGMEHVPIDQWRIDEWKKNPIILFNHNKDLPVGKGIDAKVDEEGLWMKVRISQSEVPEIKKVRDLVEEGILNSFSVGIDVESEKETEDSIHLMGVDLLESSIVSIPMNQESQFELSTKMLKEGSLKDIKSRLLKQKGAAVAARVHAKISEMQEQEGFSREDMLTKIAKESEMSLDEMFEFMAGNIHQASEKLITSLASNLGIQSSELMELNNIDTNLNADTIRRPEEIADEEEDKEEPLENGNTDTEENQESLEEEGEEILLEQETEIQDEELADEELQDESEIPLEEEEDEKQKSYAKCVSNWIKEEMEAGKPQDQAIAIAIAKCSKEKSCDLKPESWGMVFKNLAPMPTQPIQGQGYIESSPGDVGLNEAKQTNVLLAQLIGEIQGLKQIMGGAMLAAPQSLALNGQRLNTEPSKEKQENLDIIRDYHAKLNQRLDKLDV